MNFAKFLRTSFFTEHLRATVSEYFRTIIFSAILQRSSISLKTKDPIGPFFCDANINQKGSRSKLRTSLFRFNFWFLPWIFVYSSSIFTETKSNMTAVCKLNCLCDQKERRYWNTVVFVGPRAEKFSIVSNNHGHRSKCNFSVFDWKFLYLGNGQKKKSKLSV